MALELKQQLKQAQQLLMSPQLQQAIKLLQMSRAELIERVQQELLENPFLEEGKIEIEEVVAEQRPQEANQDTAYEYQEVSNNGDWEDYLGELSSTPRGSASREFEVSEEGLSIEQRYASRPSLDAHLMWQLRLSPLSEEQMDVGEIVIGNLDSAGYLRATSEEMAEMGETSAEFVESVVRIIQRFDPVGVAARNPQECLLVQIEALKYDRDPILVDLVKYHLEDLETNRYKPIMRKFKLDMEMLKEYIDIIQSLDPVPGASFGEEDPHYISPDVFVVQSDDDFVVLLNDDDLPYLQLSDLYNSEKILTSEKDKEYATKKQASASWLIKSLEQRRRTLYKVMESIVRHQRAFFEGGVNFLKPLILKDISEDIGMHESSVSRITTNKYVSTAHGMFELKFFFNSALELDDGSQVGSESVKALIQKYIAEENPKAPFPDEKLCELLKESLGVSIARRTVAKYRIALNIPSSSRRKTYF